jgi:hypothetical protein
VSGVAPAERGARSRNAPGVAAADPWLRFDMLGQRIGVQCAHAGARRMLQRCFEAMTAPHDGALHDIEWRIIPQRRARAWLVEGPSGEPGRSEDVQELLYAVDKAITLELQRRRRDLLFLHAAAVEWQGGVHLLLGDAGAGKSTTAWALLHHGFGYLSDELAPVEIASLRVLPYPRALGLKAVPAGFRLPRGVLRTPRTVHLPTRTLRGGVIREARPVRSLMLLRYDPGNAAPSVRTVSPAEATARVYVNALNALAHPACGLDAALTLARAVPCRAIDCADLAATAALIRHCVESLH